MKLDFDLPTSIRKVLLEYGLETDAPYERRIFTNRDLNLDRVVEQHPADRLGEVGGVEQLALG